MDIISFQQFSALRAVGELKPHHFGPSFKCKDSFLACYHHATITPDNELSPVHPSFVLTSACINHLRNQLFSYAKCLPLRSCIDDFFDMDIIEQSGVRKNLKPHLLHCMTPDHLRKVSPSMKQLIHNHLFIVCKGGSWKTLPFLGKTDCYFWIRLLCLFKSIGVVFLEKFKGSINTPLNNKSYITVGKFLPRKTLNGVLYVVQSSSPVPHVNSFQYLGFVKRSRLHGSPILSLPGNHVGLCVPDYLSSYEYKLTPSQMGVMEGTLKRCAEFNDGQPSTHVLKKGKLFSFLDLLKYPAGLNFGLTKVLPGLDDICKKAFSVLRFPGYTSQLESMIYQNSKHISGMSMVISVVDDKLTQDNKISGDILVGMKRNLFNEKTVYEFNEEWNLLIQ